MTIEFVPFGVKCNLSCSYCYQNSMREAGNFSRPYNLAKMIETHQRDYKGQEFTIFGGEPLLIPIAELEDIFKYGMNVAGKNGIQTNGVLITDAHIELFRKYNVNVGVSFDGPGELNGARKSGDTDGDTERTDRNITRMLSELETRRISLIVTLHKLNGIGDAFTKLCRWFRSKNLQGLANARLHFLENDGVNELVLPSKVLADCLITLHNMEKGMKNLKFDVFSDMTKHLSGVEDVTCNWRGCDPLTTSAVQGIEGDGSKANCGRVNKDGVNWVKADKWGGERVAMLYEIPQKHGGCKDCRFFFACRGECPGNSLNGDWRNKTEHCEMLKLVFAHLEGELLGKGTIPVSVAPDRRIREKAFLKQNSAPSQHRHLDHWDFGKGVAKVGRPDGTTTGNPQRILPSPVG